MPTCSCVEGLEIFSGRDKTFTFRFSTRNQAGISSAMDLTGAWIWFSMKENTDDLDEDAIVYKRNIAAGGSDVEAKITNAPLGVVEVYLKPDDTAGLPEGDYWYDIVIKNSSGKMIQGVAPSRVRVRYTVTKVAGNGE